jgi:serine/threonine-protein kinase
MDAAPSVLVAGYKLDRFELLCPIASGGMATVWLAQLRGKRGFEKLFAIKTIRTELLEDPRFQEMFLDEARIASGIQHPNVAQILDLGEQRDVLFIVMEWVDGDALAKIRKLLVKRGVKLPVGIALRVLADACAGLHAAHELRDPHGEPLGIVHRDVSPHNILVASSGSVKVIDFGIAKAQNRKQGETRTGVVKGKIQYMAPEQVKKGRTADRRADIWSLGICLHELVAGGTPTESDDDVEVIRKLLADEPPQFAAGLPDPLVRILEASVAIDPEERFATAEAMRRSLEGAMKELNEATGSEDVAAFLRSALPDLAERRRGVVTAAMDGARERGTPPVAGSRDEVAFAPTLVGDRSDGTAQAAPRREAAQVENSRIRSSAPLDDEPIRIPKRSRAGLWISLLLIAGLGGAAYRWPGLARHLVGVRAETAEAPRSAPAQATAAAIPAASVATAAAAASSSATSDVAPAKVTTGVAPLPGSGHQGVTEPGPHAPVHAATALDASVALVTPVTSTAPAAPVAPVPSTAPAAAGPPAAPGPALPASASAAAPAPSALAVQASPPSPPSSARPEEPVNPYNDN